MDVLIKPRLDFTQGDEAAHISQDINTLLAHEAAVTMEASEPKSNELAQDLQK